VSLSLEEAIRQGLQQSSAVMEAKDREAAAAATTTARRAQGLPTATASAGYLRTNHVEEFGVTSISGARTVLFPDLPNNYRVRTELDVPLYTGGRVNNLVTAAQSEQAASSADRRVTEQDVRLQVIQAYWALVTARENVGVFERGLERTDAYVRDVRSRVEAGVVSPSDLLTAQAQRARQAVRVVQAKNAAAAAEIELGRLVGIWPPQTIVTTTDVMTPIQGIETVAGESMPALIAKMSEQSGELEAVRMRRSAMLANVAVARAALRPTIGAIAAVEPSRPNQRFVPRTDQLKTSWDLGVNLTWPLFDGGRARAEAAAASAQADALGSRITDVANRLQAQLRTRMLDLDSSRAALTASDEAVAAAAEARRVLEERYRAGVATSTDVLDAQVALLEAELERTQLAATLRVSEARLLRALGGL
jgi:outer membrane protein TolC